MTTPLPTIEVNDAQLTVLLDVFKTPEGYTAWLIESIVNKVKQYKQQEIQVIYTQRLGELNTMEAEAMAAVEEELRTLTT